MVKYTILHDNRGLTAFSSDDPETELDMFNLILELSDKTTGVLSLWRVEIDPETGREKHTQVATVENGVEI